MKKKKPYLNKIKNLGLQEKMTLICLLALGTVTLFFLISLQVITKLYDTKLYEKSLLELEYFANIVKGEMDDVETLTFEIAMDREFQSQLYEMYQVQDRQVKWVAMSSFKDKMNVESVRDATIAEIIYDNREDIKYEIRNMGTEIPQEQYEKILELTGEANGGYVFMDPTEEFPYILCGRNIRERLRQTLEYLGTLIVAYDIKGFIDENMDSLQGVESNLLIYSGDTVIYNNNESLFQQIPEIEENVGYEIINRNGEKYFRSYYRAEDSDWMYVNESVYGNIYRTTTLGMQIVVFIAIALFFISYFLIKKVNRIVTYPLTNLAESMRIVENGDFEKAKENLLPVETLDEVGLLNDEFRIMLDKIVELIRENYEKQLTLSDTKYRALRAQINPHFLYNTLNSIGWMIKAGRNEEAQKMITALGSQLRSAFKEEQLSTILEEMELLDNYIFIQKVRYDEKLAFESRVDESLLYIRVPRLFLQPLVENAISYGAENKKGTCTVKVEVLSYKDKILFEVSDDGVGMSRERLKEVRSFSMQPRQNGIGLKNIHQRLELLYGKDFHFRIDSEEGQGTRIQIEIPMGAG